MHDTKQTGLEAGQAQQGELHIYTDGASRGNPGPAAIGVCITTPEGQTVEEIAETVGITTNNVAEYMALVRGLEAARSLGASEVQVFSDSELMVRQMNGVYRVKNEGLMPFYNRARSLLSEFARATFVHVPREHNRHADALANKALDEAPAAPSPKEAAAQAARKEAPAKTEPAARVVRRLPIWQVDAFTSRPLSGNPAGVVLDAGGLTKEEMLAIAREVNASETAFVMEPSSFGIADFRIRFFSPFKEVDLCGHATVATFFLLGETGRLGRSHSEEMVTVRQETGAGVLPVQVRFGEDGRVVRVMMGQAEPRFKPFEVEVCVLADALGVPEAAITESGLPVVCAYTGLWHVIVPLRSLEDIASMRPNMAALGRVNEAAGVMTTHVFTRETVNKDSTAHARAFAPNIGIVEDPQTGTASGALGAYLVANRVVSAEPGPDIVCMVFEQGYEIGRPGEINVEVEISQNEKNKITAVRVGGTAAIAFEGKMFLT